MKNTTAPALAERAQLGLHYLCVAIRVDGKFCYRRPYRNLQLNVEPYNTLRHAAAVLCLAENNYMPHQDLKLPIDWLLSKLRVVSSAPYQIAISDGEEAKLGATALSLAAFVEYLSIGGGIDEKILQGMGRHVVSQIDESGSFQSIFAFTGNPRSFNSLYYPGEAILGLIRLAKWLGCNGFLTAAIKASRALAERYISSAPAMVPADHWFVIAAAELLRISHDSQVSEAAVIVAEGIVRTARLDSNRQWVSWTDDMRLCPVATRAEALAAAVEICFLIHSPKKALEFLVCLERAVGFCLSMQVLASSRLLSSDINILGGFVESPSRNVVRIDYVQHAIGAIEGLMRVRKTVGRASRGVV